MAEEKKQFRGRRFGRNSQTDSEFDSKLLDLARVTRVTKGGRRLRFRAAVVVGNKKGKVGFGVSKGVDVSQAVEKATRIAKKNMITVPIVNGTIPHHVEAARIMLKPQSAGRGLVSGGTVRAICSLAGIRNISSKILSRTSNKINNAKATILSLKKLKIKEHASAPTETKA